MKSFEALREYLQRNIPMQKQLTIKLSTTRSNFPDLSLFA